MKTKLKRTILPPNWDYFVQLLQEKSTFPVEWLPYINMTDSKTFSGSKIIQDMAKFLCTIGEADFDALNSLSAMDGCDRPLLN